MKTLAWLRKPGTILILFVLLSGGSAMATEEPSYTVRLKSGPMEVREYPPLIAAQVRVEGDRREAVKAGFRLLAGYIFGGNTRKQKIAMTAPVVQAPAKGETIAMTAPVMQTRSEGAWTVRFLMPKGYTMDTLPTPNDPQVQLIPLPAARMAVVRFSGLAHEPDIQQKTADLKAFMAAHKLVATGPPSLARYNPPWTPWFMRRNEIMIPIKEPESR
jgi:hypothetical protein